MKKTTLTSIVAMACAAAVLAGCGKKQVEVSDVAVFPANITIKIGKSYSFSATVIPTDATDKGVVWASSNNDVATVSATGEVTAVAAGRADITARASDGSGKLGKGTVKVIPQPTVTVTSSLDLTKVNEFKYSTMVDAEGKPASPITINVAATRGLSALKVTLATDNAEINGAIVGMGLDGQFDLAALSAEKAAVIGEFFGGGVPTGEDVALNETVTLDLSAIAALVAQMPGGVGQFDVTVEASDIYSPSTEDPMITQKATLKMKFVDDTNVAQ